MIGRAVDAGVPAAWVAGDEVYGADPKLRAAVRGHGLGYVLAVGGQPAGSHRRRPDPRRRAARAAARPRVAAALRRCRQQGPAAVLVGMDSRCCPKTTPTPALHHLLIRRNDTTGELAYLRCYSPRPVPLRTLVRVAGQRWRIEESFQAAKGLAGLDQHQVRRWTSWHRWTTLAMLAHAFLAVATADRTRHPPRTRPD